METLREPQAPTAEILLLKGPFKPSWLAGWFKYFATEMVQKDMGAWKNEAVTPKHGIGPTIHVSNYGWVKKVEVSHRPDKEIEHFQIDFSHSDELKTDVHENSCVAKFSVSYQNEFGKASPPREFERTELHPGDEEVNEFFRDMTNAIDPDNLRNS